MADELFMLKNYFWLGNFQLGIREAGGIRPSSDEVVTERDAYVYRCYIGMGNPGYVLDETELDGDEIEPPIAAVKLLAEYESDSSDTSRAKVVESLKELLKADVAPGKAMSMAQTIAATVFYREGELPLALATLRDDSDMEQMSLTLQIHIAMSRIDLAQKQLLVLQQVDDDSTLTQLCMSWLYLITGGAKYQEASYIYQELIDKYGPTVLLLNGLGVANIHLSNYEAADQAFQEALGMNAKDGDTLVNIITCAQWNGKGDSVIQGYIKQLNSVSPNHAWLKRNEKLENLFKTSAESNKQH